MVALSTTPTAFETMPQTMYLTESIAADASSCKINYVPLAVTAGILIIDEGEPNEERISFNGVTNNGDGTATLSNLGRGLAYGGGTAYAASGTTAYEHTGNSSTVRLVIAHEYLNKAVFTDRASLIGSSVELQFGATSQAVYGTATELYFKSSTTAAKSLAQLAAAAGTDEKAKVSINDTTSDYILNKLSAGDGITLTETNDGGDEDVTIAQNRALLKPTLATTLTIASGVVTATQTNHKIDTESAASTDDLDTISGGAEGQIIIIRQANSGRAVVVKNGTGNIQLAAGDFTLSDGKQQLPLQYDGSNWRPWGIVASAWMGQILSVSTTVSGDTSEHDFSKTVSIGANTLSAGSKIIIRALVLCANAAGSNAVTTKAKSGSTTWLSLGAINPSDLNPYTIDIRGEFEVRTTGAGGTMYGTGTVQGSSNTDATSKESKLITGSTTSIDTTVANVITISGQLGNSGVGNNAILQTLSVRVIPPNSTTA